MEQQILVQNDQAIPRAVDQLPLVLTLKDAAEYLQYSVMTIRRRVWSGRIRSYREGQEHRIRREWLLEYEASLIAASQSSKEV
ncbi:helix-turn-helix domain-containing protein [Paenibacillus hemerocallicola]|uniref:Helix-turn-helix domain-containing protein n=1 Tax=Paenibacillus hemerocallicola TaxID=1172614 RepID=A0A5C4TIC2_9BACL|nr:helix-turn-helix domain-containing protein [Paenibacillus hemerocallicola]TNJ68189.1 helix-turn-helix domain-containing protein [Paenibacillus hemerocallicola]